MKTMIKGGMFIRFAKKGDGSNDYDLTKALRIRITLDNNYNITQDSQWPYDEDWNAHRLVVF